MASTSPNWARRPFIFQLPTTSFRLLIDLSPYAFAARSPAARLSNPRAGLAEPMNGVRAFVQPWRPTAPCPRDDPDRKSVGEGKSGAVRLDLGVRRNIKKKKTK